MKNILFPTDFSLNSLHAIRYGINLFKGQEVTFFLFNGYVDPSAGASMTMIYEEHMKAISMVYLEKLYEDLQEEFTGLEMTLKNGYGDLPHVIDPIIESEQIDLVILGSSGASGPSLSLFGSNAYSCMKHLSCPVLSVPIQSSIKEPKITGLASKEILSGKEEYLAPLFELSKMSDSEIIGLHVLSDDSEVDFTSEQEDLIPYKTLTANQVELGIESAIGEYNIELLTIIIPNHTFLDNLFHKSVSKQLARHVHVPLLSIRNLAE